MVHSDLSIERYHAFSDATMDRMLESIETILDDLGDPNYEVEYSVCISSSPEPRQALRLFLGDLSYTVGF